VPVHRQPADSLDTLLAADAQARLQARALIHGSSDLRARANA
jgi:hypothetical protein